MLLLFLCLHPLVPFSYADVGLEPYLGWTFDILVYIDAKKPPLLHDRMTLLSLVPPFAFASTFALLMWRSFAACSSSLSSPLRLHNDTCVHYVNNWQPYFHANRLIASTLPRCPTLHLQRQMHPRLAAVSLPNTTSRSKHTIRSASLSQFPGPTPLRQRNSLQNAHLCT
jgi:hypothetical protein